MKFKKIITAALLLFVVASVACLIIKEYGNRTSTAAPGKSATATTAEKQADSAGTIAKKADNTAKKEQKSQVMVYYFHGTARCVTCRTIEAWTKEAIQTAFPAELVNGRVKIQIVNVENPGQAHFVQDFQLTSSSVVLVQLEDGKIAKWQNLDQVWNLVHKTKPIFLHYIQNATRAMLKKEKK